MENREWSAIAMEEEHEVTWRASDRQARVVHDQGDGHEGEEDTNDERDISFLHLVHLG